MKTCLLIIFIYFFVSGAFADCTVKDTDKIDCATYTGVDQSKCEARGCCWYQGSGLKSQSNDVPWCFFPAGFTPCNSFTLDYDNPGFDQSWYSQMYKNFMNGINFDSMGGVLGATDRFYNSGSYIFHWRRNAGLTMQTFMDLNNNSLSAIDHTMQAYTAFVLYTQDQIDPNGIDIRGEPKFNVPQGEVYDQSWCRPQTDGPAAESIAFINYANTLLNNQKSAFVQKYLWTNDDTQFNGGLIKYNLDYIVNNWRMTSCDIWEGTQSADFFWNTMAFYKALTLGSTFATKMGDSASSVQYSYTAGLILQQIQSHYNGQYIYESLNQQKDGAVIMALNIFGVYSPTDPQVAATINTFNQLFCALYQINQVDELNNFPGILYGRYQSDTYEGGNPNNQITPALAELFYKQSVSLLSRKDQVVSAEEAKAWKNILKLSDNPSIEEFSLKAKRAGDSILYRLYMHVQEGQGEISEQIDRYQGTQTCVGNSILSYANLLHALYYRQSQQLDKLESRFKQLNIKS